MTESILAHTAHYILSSPLICTGLRRTDRLKVSLLMSFLHIIFTRQVLLIGADGWTETTRIIDSIKLGQISSFHNKSVISIFWGCRLWSLTLHSTRKLRGRLTTCYASAARSQGKLLARIKLLIKPTMNLNIITT